MYRNSIKPFFDFIGALLLVPIVGPIIILVAVILAFSTGGHPFFLQKRPGKNGRMFTIIKFKTMNNKTDVTGKLLPDAERLTTIGKFIRSSSLDELPQLLNVLIGNMSFVGPRPLLPEYLTLYNEIQKQRHNVKPGITGWAQVNGRNAISWQQKFEFDVWYVNNQSFTLDLKILYKTVVKVIKKEAIDRAEDASLTRFKGN